MAKQKKIKKAKSSNRGSFILGLTIICLAIVGICFLVSFGVGKVKTLTNKDNLKNEYETLLYPVVMLDPDTFDDVTNANMENLITASILSLLTDSENSPDKFDFVEGNVSGLAIKQSTVEEAFKKLFGSSITPVHQSVQCSTCVFQYQGTAQRYVIPITGYDPAYTPKVIEINKSKEGTVELTVGYIAYGDWATDKNNDFTEPDPAKYRKITLRPAESGYYISAIQNADVSQLVKNDKAEK